MEDYNKILESLSVRFVKVNSLITSQTIEIKTLYDARNTLIVPYNGNTSFRQNGIRTAVKKGEILLIPGREDISVTLGRGKGIFLDNEALEKNRKQYLDSYEIGTPIENENAAAFLLITFETKAFGSVNFFTALGIPTFILDNAEISNIAAKIYNEASVVRTGNIRFANVLTEELTIQIFRYIIEKSLFVEQLATNMNYFKDPRLVKVFSFIKENLADDLSNKTLADVADVSEDYVGQYFKMLTSINPQDYIEYQRMERAVDLLRSSTKSIKDIGCEVGYKDTAYFCRRFKMMFGIPAGKMRRREALLGV